jgi:hypothetical protein
MRRLTVGRVSRRLRAQGTTRERSYHWLSNAVDAKLSIIVVCQRLAIQGRGVCHVLSREYIDNPG